MEYLVYDCKFCGRRQKTTSNNPGEIIRCYNCKEMVCKKCGKLSFCPKCMEHFSEDDKDELKNLLKLKTSAEFRANIGCWSLILGIILIIFHFMDPRFDLIWYGAGIFILGIIAIKVTFKKSNIADDNFNQKVYEFEKKLKS